jgi:hypothetical protein
MSCSVPLKRARPTCQRLPRSPGKKTSKAQRRQQERFKLARAYAQAARTEPVYAKLAAARRTYTTAYHLAFSDWCHGPEIHAVSRRSRCIRIDANDNVHVAKVRVTISDDEGKTLQQGDAARVYDAWWEFETRTNGNILVEVWDLAGNVARQEA